MATLTANSGRVYELNEDPLYDDVPVDAATTIFEGAAVGENASTGLARPLVSGDTFLGFAAAKSDNSAGAAGDQVVRVMKRGTVKLSVTTVAGVADLGATVNASDDDTFLLGAGSAIGKVGRHISGTTCMVRFEAAAVRSL